MTRLFINFTIGIIGVWSVLALGGMVDPASVAKVTHAVTSVFTSKS